jgi:hypothetical protein
VNIKEDMAITAVKAGDSSTTCQANKHAQQRSRMKKKIVHGTENKNSIGAKCPSKTLLEEPGTRNCMETVVCYFPLT